jgi:hypothetical protein
MKSQLKKFLVVISAASWPAVFFTFSAGAQTLCPDGSYVSGSTGGQPSQIAPDGSYTSGPPRIAPNSGYVGGQGPVTICPDGSFVAGSCHLAPNGKYVGD